MEQTRDNPQSPATQGAALRWRRIVGVLVPVALFSAVIWLLVRRFSSLDPQALFAALAAYPIQQLLICVGLSLLAYAACSSYDLLALRILGLQSPGLRAAKVLPISFTATVMGLNLGSLVGAWALRARLYLRAGLSPVQVASLISVVVATNWLGFAAVAAAALVMAPGLTLPWPIDPLWMQFTGLLLGLLLGGYLLACHHLRDSTVSFWRGRRVRLPPLRLALAQIALGALNWLSVAAVIHVLLRAWASYEQALLTYQLAAVAGAATHIPGGLGILEGSVVSLLADAGSQTQILAGVLGFRAIHYLLPLAAALLLYPFLERRSVPGRR